MDRDYEAEAREEGWRPKEEFSGDPEKWVDAQKFVEKGEKLLPLVKKKLERVESELSQVKQTAAKHNEWTQKSIDKEKARNKELIAELEEARAKAITEGDGQEFTRVERKLESLKETDETDPSVDEYDRIANKWASENTWYADDQDLHIYADGVADIIAQEGYTGRAYFKELTRRVKKAHPEKFENKARERANGVEEPGGKKSQAKPKSYEALPAEDRKQCDEFIRDIPGFTKEDFLREYDWE